MALNNMKGSIPEALGNLEQLTVLFFYGNRLEGSIPEALAGLEQLTNLDLRLNRLTGVVPSLPFKNYTSCWLQSPTSPSNHYTCPLPPVSPLSRAPRAQHARSAAAARAVHRLWPLPRHLRALC